MAKSTRPTIRVHDSISDEIIDREMNDAEFAEYNKLIDELAQEKIARETKVTERQAIADRLGLNADELKLLLG
jgi:hypothetical protein